MTTRQRAYIIGEYLAGRNEPNRIADELGINKKSVTEFAYRHHLTRKNRLLTSEEEEYILRNYKWKEFGGLQKMASKLGCKVHKIENHIRKMRKDGKL